MHGERVDVSGWTIDVLDPGQARDPASSFVFPPGACVDADEPTRVWNPTCNHSYSLSANLAASGARFSLGVRDFVWLPASPGSAAHPGFGAQGTKCGGLLLDETDPAACAALGAVVSHPAAAASLPPLYAHEKE